MTEISANSDFALAVAAAIATLGILAYTNRREVSRVKDSVFGNDRSDEDDGLVGEVSTLESELEDVGDHIEDKLDSIEEKIDEEREERRVDHKKVTSEMRKTRVLVHVSVEGLVDTLNSELDADVDPDDIRPDWIEDDVLEADGGPAIEGAGGGEVVDYDERERID